jgi:hypothetical protein
VPFICTTHNGCTLPPGGSRLLSSTICSSANRAVPRHAASCAQPLTTARGGIPRPAGKLRLKVAYDWGLSDWASAEVQLPQSLGYGTYNWKVSHNPAQTTTNMAGGMFLYERRKCRHSQPRAARGLLCQAHLCHDYAPFDMRGFELEAPLPRCQKQTIASLTSSTGTGRALGRQTCS